MKVSKTAKGNVKVVMSSDEAAKLKRILGETTTEWIMEESGMTREDAQEHEEVSDVLFWKFSEYL